MTQTGSAADGSTPVGRGPRAAEPGAAEPGAAEPADRADTDRDGAGRAFIDRASSDRADRDGADRDDDGADGDGAEPSTPSAGPAAPPAGLDTHLPDTAPRPGRTVLVAVLLLLAAGAAMWAALDTVGSGRLDARFLGEAVESRTGGLNTVAVTITEVGNTFAMALLATLVGIWCWARGRRADAVFVVGAMAGAALLFRGIKILVDRPRPPAIAQVVRESNESLPSGHATMSMVVIGSLVVLAWAGRGRAARVAMVVAGALWVGAVGSTRVYLGVHWFSDVLIGWLLGAAWLTVCAATWSWWRRRAARPGPTMISGNGT